MPNRLPPRPRNRTATLGLLLSLRYSPAAWFRLLITTS